MRVDTNHLSAHLEKKLAPLYVLVGDEALAQSECLDAIRAAAQKNGADERASYIVERFFNWQSVTQYNHALSLFSSKRILEVKIPSGKPGLDGSKALIELSQKPMSDTTVIVILPKLERESKNSAWFDALQLAGIVIELNEIAPSQLPQWLHTRLATQNQSADAQSLAFIAHLVEGNLLAAHQEIQKLGLLYPAGEISFDLIQESILNVSRYDASKLGDAILQCDATRTAYILQGLQDEGENPIAVMNPLIWLLRPLISIKQAQARGENLNSAISNARVFGDKQTLIKQGLQRFSLRQLNAALQKLCDIDKTAKGVMQGDAWLELSRLCFGLAKVRARS